MTKSVNKFLNFSMQPQIRSGILVYAYLLYDDNIFTWHTRKIFYICLKLWIFNDAIKKSLHFNNYSLLNTFGGKSMR